MGVYVVECTFSLPNKMQRKSLVFDEAHLRDRCKKMWNLCIHSVYFIMSDNPDKKCEFISLNVDIRISLAP